MNSPPNQNRGPGVLAVAWTTISVAILTTLARFVARFRLRAYGLDDALIVLALAISILGGVSNIFMVQAGFGRHIEYISPSNQIEMAHWSFVATLQACPGSTITKLSIGCFLLRMLSGVSGSYRYIRIAIYTNMAVLVTVMIVFMVADLVSCRPLEASWNPAVKGTCMSKTRLSKFALAVNIVNVLTDFFCVITPLFIIRSLQMNRRTKIAVAVILMLGLLTACCSIGRAVTVNYNVADPSWGYVSETIWVIMEQNVAICVANLPACRQLFTSFSRVFATRRSDGSGANSSWLSSSRFISRITSRPSDNAKAFETLDSQNSHVSGRQPDKGRNDSVSLGHIGVRTDIILEASKRDQSEVRPTETELGFTEGAVQ